MKKILTIIFFLALLTSSCSQKSEIQGTINDAANNGKQVFLLTFKNHEESFEKADSTVITNGKFSFNIINPTEPKMAFIAIKEQAEGTPNLIPFVYEKGNINISIDSLFKISGTEMNDRLQTYFSEMTAKSQKKLDLQLQYQMTSDSTLLKQIDRVVEEMKNTAFSFVKTNIKNKVGEYFFMAMLGFLNEEQTKELLNEANSDYKKMIETFMNSNLSSEDSLVGKKYIDITGKNPDGQLITLSNYISKNQVVLIDFWASWCGPCRQEMPHVVKAYQKYKSKGFEIIGISLDENDGAWKKALTDMNMTWPQMSDLKGWKSELSAPYNVNSIPYTLLVDQQGNIIAENLRGDQLINTLDKILR